MTYRTLKNKGYSTAWSHSMDMRNNPWVYVYGTGSQWHQLFRYNAQTKQIYNQNGKVLDVRDSKNIEGEYVGHADSNTNRVQQRWIIRYVDKMNKTATSGIGSMGNIEIGKPFFIQSRLWMERVMYHHPNNHVYIHARKPNEKRQMWIYDEHSKTIKSFYELDRYQKEPKKHRSLDTRSGHVTVQITDSRYYQMFTYAESGHLFTKKSEGSSNENYCVVQSNVDSEGRAVYREHTRKTSGDNWYQLWDIIYVDEAPNLEKGFADEWGMWINRPFHIVSEFGENRYLDLVSNRVVIKTRNSRESQLFRFDMKYRTIKV